MAATDNFGRVIIFSSSKRLDIARAVQINLQDEFDCAIWDQGVFPVSTNVLSSILSEIEGYDFAICVLGPDLDIREDGTRWSAMPNDNVLLELGISTGYLGVTRTFTLVPRDITRIRLPVYVTSNNNILYKTDTSKNLRSQLGAPCNIFRDRAKTLGMRKSTSFKVFGQRIEFAGSLCFRVLNGEFHFLSVQSTAGRRTIPKGRVDERETVSEAALRYAHDEGGVVGHTFTNTVFGFRHAKVNSPGEQMIAVKLIEFEDDVPPRAKFRDPKWHKFEDAKVELMRNRRYEYAREIRDLFDSVLPVLIEALRPVQQAAALPYRRNDDGLQILLVTSKSSRRWIIPKGNIHDDESVEQAALREAFEEAGVRGHIESGLDRVYSYERDGRRHLVSVRPLRVATLVRNWEDRLKRERAWFSVEEAADRASEEELKQLILEFGKIVG